MRNVAARAMERVDAVLGRLDGQMQQGNTLTENEQLRIYRRMRGNPTAILAYASEVYQKHPVAGSNPMIMADEYEKSMEAKLRSRE
jgi:hypothetical protein